MVLATPDARGSDWCQREWNVLAARNATGAKIVPITLDLNGSDLGALSNFQALDADDPALEQKVLVALGHAARPWEVSADDIVALHGAWIDWQYRQAPILGKEPFKLSEVYIDTECGHVRCSLGSCATSRKP